MSDGHVYHVYLVAETGRKYLVLYHATTKVTYNQVRLLRINYLASSHRGKIVLNTS